MSDTVKGSTTDDLRRLATGWAVRLTTFRRDGTPVGTVVNLAATGDRVFFRTYEESGKFKRLRNNHDVVVRPSTWRGMPTGPAHAATAKLLEGADDDLAAALIDRAHPVFQRILVRLGHRVRRLTTRHFELRPTLESSGRPDFPGASGSGAPAG